MSRYSIYAFIFIKQKNSNRSNVNIYTHNNNNNKMPMRRADSATLNALNTIMFSLHLYAYWINDEQTKAAYTQHSFINW